MLASADDRGARFLYRASVKGSPSLTLPRPDTEEWLATHIAGGYRTAREDIEAPCGPPVQIALGAGEVVGSIDQNAPAVRGEVGDESGGRGWRGRGGI